MGRSCHSQSPQSWYHILTVIPGEEMLGREKEEEKEKGWVGTWARLPSVKSWTTLTKARRGNEESTRPTGEAEGTGERREGGKDVH